MFDEQRLVNVIRSLIRAGTKNGARVQYSDGYVHSGSSYLVTAYMNGDETFLNDSIIPMTGAYVGAGDYIQVATNEFGRAWISRIKETNLYSKIAIDANRGRILIGDGTSPPTNAGAIGEVLISGGPDSPVYWGSGSYYG